MRRLNNNGCYHKIASLIDYYYSKCPGSIMPLFLLYCAKEGLLEVGDRTRYIQHTDEEQRLRGIVFAQFTAEDARELSLTDPAGKHLLDKWECGGNTQLSMLLHYDRNDNELQEIRSLFQKHDENLGTSMEQRRVLFLLAQGLLNLNPDSIGKDFLKTASLIVERSGLFPYAEDYRLSCFETAIAGRMKGGNAYYPFARVPYVAAMFADTGFSVEFTGTGKELACAVARLIMRARGKDGVSCRVCDKPLDMIEQGKKYDLVISNRVSKSDSEHNDEPTIHYVLKKTLGCLSDNGCFIGLDDMRFFFNSTCRREAFRRSVDEGKVARIILLPRKFGKVMVEMRNGRKGTSKVDFVNLYNNRLPLAIEESQRLLNFIHANTVSISVSEIRSHRYSMGDFFKYKVGDAPEGMKRFSLGKLIYRIEKSSSSLGLAGTDFDDIWEVDIDRDEKFNPFRFIVHCKKCDDMGIFEPAYSLNDDTLLLNDRGSLEPRIFRPGSGTTAICREGHAFGFKPDVYPPYIINELMKPYMKEQLEDWARTITGKHSGDELLSLDIFCPVDRFGNFDWKKQEEICKNELDESYLPKGFVVESSENPYKYIVEETLGHGAFGITYRATRTSYCEDDGKPVALKEFFVRLEGITERGEDHVAKHNIGSIDDIRRGSDEAAERRRFIDEAEKMQRFGNYEDSHIRSVSEIFTCRETNNMYYVMDYYDNGTLLDVIKRRGSIPEDEATEKYIIPLAKALHVLHSGRCAHLDMKPENVLIDDEGYAVLGDFDISKLYGEDGRELSHGERGSSSEYAPSEECNQFLRSEFHPEMDIYALGAISYHLLTGDNPGGFDAERFAETERGISDGARRAIISAMEEDYEQRTSDVMDFVHSLPGCEDMEFVIRENEQEEEETFDFDFDFDYDDCDLPEDICDAV